MQRIPPWLSGVLIFGALVGLFMLERQRPLRGLGESRFRRLLRNAGIGGIGASALFLAELPVTYPLALYCQRQRWGLLPHFTLPGWLATTFAVILMDYTLYVWHVLNHKVPFLWRFHKAHHVDLDLDASTGIRFHFGELLLSVGWRAMQIVVIGITPFALSIWSTLTILEVLFHHSNVKLPITLERWLNRLIITPRMHGIHHSIVERETNSNWSSGLTLWDWLHGTLRLNVPQEEITIGVPAYQDPEQVTLPQVLAMPFSPQPRDDWQSRDGTHPQREELSRPRSMLAR